MYSIDDVRTPRDRVDEDLLRRLFEEENSREVCCGTRAERRNDTGKGCGQKAHDMIEGNCSLAMVYAPRQIWRGIYDLDTAMTRGTMFKELDKPWEVSWGKGGCGCGK